MRRALTLCALAATAGLAVPTQAVAQPAPPVLPDLAGLVELPQFEIPADLSVESLTDLLAGVRANPEEAEAVASLAPAIIGAAAGPADVADGKNDLLAQAKELLANSELPESVKSTLQRVITFLDGSGGGGPEIPEPGAVVISQFLYPTIGKGCIGDSQDSVGTALAVAGPSHLPPPGPGAGQTGFVFTALGTAPAAGEQQQPLTLSWVNVSNGRTGTQPLTNDAKINPDGPTTLSAIADTGSGQVLAVISGGITTQDEGADPRSCTFLPTVGLVAVP
ncbi:hypothetical protein LSF60_18630 [Rhodococcus pyridinivorans]|uniref:Rv1157c family protein n=1 Tax=Rhodococcus pyridinivorans TaxID=103816 RepID=UPI001E51FB58|nr:hypothetical protein [Rhodococcus pyridinivorans]UGQ60272.1 hypothetical protein LSF60_18630 [Rhodococcus pyridinivorans]